MLHSVGPISGNRTMIGSMFETSDTLTLVDMIKPSEKVVRLRAEISTVSTYITGVIIN